MSKTLEWRIVIGIEPHWVTAEEKDSYIAQIQKGVDLVMLRNGLMFLSSKPKEIVHISQIQQTDRVEENIKKGFWQCTFGNWHEGHCYCNIEEISDGTVTVVRLKNPSIRLDPNTPSRILLNRNITLERLLDEGTKKLGSNSDI